MIVMVFVVVVEAEQRRFFQHASRADILRRMSALEAWLAGQNDYRKNAEKLREDLRDSLHIDRLTLLVLRKLVERIEVGQANWVDGERRQEIVIG